MRLIHLKHTSLKFTSIFLIAYCSFPNNIPVKCQYLFIHPNGFREGIPKDKKSIKLIKYIFTVYLLLEREESKSVARNIFLTFPRLSFYEISNYCCLCSFNELVYNINNNKMPSSTLKRKSYKKK